MQIVQRNQRIKEKDAYKKREDSRGYENIYQEAQLHLVLDSGACVIRRGEQLKR
jgi:hypothetical protein